MSPWSSAHFSRRALLAAPWACGLTPAHADTVTISLPHHLSAVNPQLPYMARVVTLALQRAGHTADVRLADLEMSQGRSLLELSRGTSPMDVMWTVTDRQREASGLLPVRVPIDRGLMGWRLLLVRNSELPRWHRLRGLADLRQLKAGQGHDWPDTAILRANGLEVETSSNYESLFRMLAGGRFDYFPRAILEVDAEMAGNRHPELAIAPDLMLHYPAAAYLFVSPTRPELAAALKAGLEAAVADGSFQRLHREQYGAVLKAHPISAHRVLRLNNPLLPPETPVQRRELWLQPGEAA